MVTHSDTPAPALGLYDVLIMFSQEYTMIWRREFNMTSILFLCARLMLVALLPLAIAEIWNSPRKVSCQAYFGIAYVLMMSPLEKYYLSHYRAFGSIFTSMSLAMGCRWQIP